MHIINATNQGTLASLKRATAIANYIIEWQKCFTDSNSQWKQSH